MNMWRYILKIPNWKYREIESSGLKKRREEVDDIREEKA